MKVHIQYTQGSKLDGYEGWGTPAAESHNRVRRSGTLATICTEESRRVQQATPVTIFMTLPTAVFGFHQAWQWEPNLSISLKPHIVSCWSVKNTSWPPPPSPRPPDLELNMPWHVVLSSDCLIYKGGANGVFRIWRNETNHRMTFSLFDTDVILTVCNTKLPLKFGDKYLLGNSNKSCNEDRLTLKNKDRQFWLAMTDL